MSNAKIVQRDAAHPTDATDPAQLLRELGGRAHQLRAATRAADHYCGMDAEEDRSTGSWLMSCAVGLAAELAADVDGLARGLRESAADAALEAVVAGVRVRAYQLHAAARAADHFLDQDNHEDRETGSWLIACALGVALKLAAELDNSVAPARRPLSDKARVEAHDPKLVRSISTATAIPAGRGVG